MGGFLQAVDELAQVLDGVDVVVGRRRYGVGALGDHAGAGHLLVDLLAGQMPPDAGLGALADLDLDGGLFWSDRKSSIYGDRLID